MNVNNGAATASPIERADDASNFELNVTQLSLPDSFDDSLCLDLYGGGMKVNARSASPSDDDNIVDAASLSDDAKLCNLEKKEKCSRYGSSEQSSSSHYVTVIDELRTQLARQISLNDAISKREKDLQHQILEYKQRVQVLNLDLTHARNEAHVFLHRAEKAEQESDANATSLKSIQHKYDATISRHSTEQEDAKREISRIREECKTEIAASRVHQNEAFTRESKLLCDARDHAIDQVQTLQRELSELRHERESKEAEYLEINKELERQLSDVRSELKVKVYEFNTLRACQDRAVAESNQLKKESTETKAAFAQLRNEYVTLERQTAIERNRSEEIIRQKCELLEIYQHEDLLIEDDNECGTSEAGDVENTFTGRKSLLRNSIALASKCRKLQSGLKQLSDELAIEQEKNKLLAKTNTSNQRLFQELAAQTKKSTSSTIVAVIKTKDKEIFDLSSKMNELQLQLSKTKQERDDSNTRLNELVQRRNQAKEMKALVESMRKSIVVTANSGNDKTRQVYVDDDEDDLLDHVVHHDKVS